MGFRLRRGRSILAIATVAVLGVLAPLPVRAAGQPNRAWLAGWATSQAEQPRSGVPLTEPDGRTLRLLARTTAEGPQVRIRLANTDGSGPVTFGRVTVGIHAAASGPVVVPGTIREVRFGGRPSLTLAPGVTAVSDPVNLAVGVGSDLAVSLHVVSALGSYSGHQWSKRLSWLSSPGTGDQTLDEAGTAFHWSMVSSYWLSGIDVLTTRRPVVVAIGDSITDGHLLAPDMDQDWPSVLSSRLKSSAAVINAGIAGNQLSRNGGGGSGPGIVNRFGRDVLDVPGVTHVVVFAGTNDIATGVPAARLASAMTAIANRAHARGIKVIGATITPRQDLILGWNLAVHEPIRQAFNAWVRTAKVLDAVADFDVVLRDPADPTQLDRRYDSGDRLHPNAVGLAALGNSVDPRLISR